MLKKLAAGCASSNVQPSVRDSLIGAAVLIGCSLLFCALGIVAKRNGLEVAGEVILAIAFPGSVLLAMPFTYLKGRPWAVQAGFVLVPLLIVIMITLLAELI